ncbi:inhibitor of cysteine proteases [Plasmodium gaboni]|uniref:Inhibitor of cysteine proteases n=1 Tax=Plasmodium gaboni TaxID=647221 RepID=A0ABY1ULT3_9APIC|nr:inhibitor of cysteine proteases [Plasmodium gaboni]
MNHLIFLSFFLLSCIAHLSRCSDNNTYSFEIVNRSTWLNIAERIFKGNAPFNFTIIPYNYVNNSTKENNNNKDSVLLISKNLKDSSNPVDENSHIIDSTTKANTSNNNNNNNNNNSNNNIVGLYESEVREEKIKEDNTQQGNILKKENEIINSDQKVPVSNIFSKNIDNKNNYIESNYKSSYNTNNPELIHSTDFIGSNNNHTFNFLSRYNSILNNMQGSGKVSGNVPEFKARIFSEEETSELGSGEKYHDNALNPNEPCDQVIKLGDIINSINEKTLTINSKTNNVLCINLDSVSGNGFVWSLLGVHKQKPLIDPSNFPTKRVTQSYVSQDITVTNPVPLPKNSNSNKSDSINNSKEGSYNNTTSNNYPKATEQLVGGSSMLISKIKPHKPGHYFIVYAYYRPFDPTRDTNTRIIELNVQ